MKKQELIKIIKEKISQVVGLDINEIYEDESFLRMGISSIQSVKIINLIQKELNMELNPVILFRYETINELVDHFIENEMSVENG